MMRRYFKITIIFLFMLLSTTLAHAEVRVRAKVLSNELVYAGDPFIYQIILEGAEKAGSTNVMEKLAEFNPQGPDIQTSSQTTIINGKINQSVSYNMNYQLSVNQVGEMILPSVEVVVEGQTYQTNPVRVDIQQPGQTDKIAAEMKLSKTSCYVGEPIVLTFNWLLDERISKVIRDPSINIPAVLSDAFILEDVADKDQAKQALKIGQIEMPMFSSYRQIGDQQFVILSFKKVLIPQQTGLLTLEPGMVSVDIAVSRKRSSWFNDNYVYRRYMAESESLTLEVRPLPSNAPAGFNGLVGEYQIKTEAAPTTVYVGDPITLSIRIGRSEVLKQVQWPDLDAIPGFTDDFKVPSERSMPETQKGYKLFTQTIRAKHDRVTEIPPIDLVYFDSQKGKYVTVSSDPIPLEVQPTEVVTSSDIEGVQSADVYREVEAVKMSLSANYENLDALDNQSFSIRASLIGIETMPFWLIPCLIFLASCSYKISTRTSPESLARKKRKNAIKEIRHLYADRDQMLSVMRQYIGDRFGCTAGSLTAADCQRIITEHTNDTQAADRFREIFEQCEAGAYSGMGSDVTSSTVDELKQLIMLIDKKSR